MSCHCFHGFFIPFTEFQQKSTGFRQKPPGTSHAGFQKNGRFIGQTDRFISEIGHILMFPVFTVPPSSLVRFCRIFPIFADFCRIFQKLTGSVRSDFSCSAEFLNTEWNCSLYLVCVIFLIVVILVIGVFHDLPASQATGCELHRILLWMGKAFQLFNLPIFSFSRASVVGC
jgi:hypothetical protein